MDKKTIEQLKIKLLEEKNRIESELKSIATKDKALKEDWDAKFPQFGDSRSEQDENADETEEYEINISI